MANVNWTAHAWDDYLYWQGADQKVLAKINELIKDIQRTPFTGIGKPEPLKFQYKGYWSRRINREHRLVYKFADNTITIIQCRYHT